MDTVKYTISCDYELHKDFVQNNIRNFGSDHPDVILISEDGREASTNKIFLSLFTPIFNNICSDAREKTDIINVPFPHETIVLLLQFLTTGYVNSQEEHTLSTLIELMNCLKINIEDMKINQTFPRAKPNKRNGIRRENIHIKKENNDNFDPIKIEQDFVFIEELPESDFTPKKSTKKKQKKSKTNILYKEKEKFGDISEDQLGEEENSLGCRICKKQFKNRNRLEAHRVTHTKEKSYECSECGKKFGTPGILYNHSFVHNPPHHCTICSFKFAQKSGLQNHIKKTHGSS